MEIINFHCSECPGERPMKVGKAIADAVGNVDLVSMRRTGKRSPRAQRTDGRLVDQGIPIRVRWSAVSEIDIQEELRNTERHKTLVGEALPDSWVIGLYRCAEGHWVGTKDIGELLGWIDKALEYGARSLPLPLLDQPPDEPDPSAFDVASIPMEPLTAETPKQPA
jgi:hypothetical protein